MYTLEFKPDDKETDEVGLTVPDPSMLQFNSLTIVIGHGALCDQKLKTIFGYLSCD